MAGAGKFNKRVMVERPNPEAVENAAGQIDLTDDASWSTWCERWAWFLPQGGREYQLAKQQQADLTHLIRLLWDSAEVNLITPQMRIRLFDHGVWRTINILECHTVEEDRRTFEIRGMEVK